MENGPQRGRGEGAFVQPREPSVNGVFPFGHIEGARASRVALGLAHGLHQAGAVVEEAQQVLVQGVDAPAEIGKGRKDEILHDKLGGDGHGVLRKEKPPSLWGLGGDGGSRVLV